ncbi:rapamycin-insensitive companion of mTOR-like [Littorina saxatilis]|uniref:Rapamycin-insensitive companion of mTOR n=1 Tax=Littorina saxatilis TaxID=31220 RepID=A0AAN9B6F5_9CAEN
MAAAVGRSGRFRHRFRVRHESGEDNIRLDFDRDPADNVKEILRHVVMQQGVSKAKKLAYLNNFVKLISKQGEDRALGLGSIEILTCLQIGLLHEAKEVRAAVLRVLRYLIQGEDMLTSFLALHLDYLVMRCLDVCLDNEIERLHAIRLIRQINSVAPNAMPCSLLYTLLAIGNDGSSEHDRFLRVSLATLCEIAFRNVDLVGKCGGISTLLWNILDSHQYPRLNESLTCTIMYLMNHPRSRHYIKAHTDLETLLAPLTDSQFHLSGETSAEDKQHQQQMRRDEIESRAREERETRFVASKLALITLMHTWPGLIRLCHPRGSGLQSLIGILYLPYTEIRKHILEMISDVFRLSLPDWTDDFSLALLSVDPTEHKDLWKVSEGFVAEEGRSLLPHCASTRPNLVENHLALLLSAWINAGLLEALIEVVTSSEGPLFNRTIILLGEMLHMANVLLPAECYSHNHCLPVLLTMASSTDLSGPQRHRACLAVKHLNELHSMKKRGLVPSSLFLDLLLQHAGKFKETTNRHWYFRRDTLRSYYYRKMPNDDNTQHAVRDSQVNTTKENYNWDWDLIGSILKWPDDRLRKMEDQIYIRFLRRVVFYFKPTNHLFSHMDLNAESGPSVCLVACQLVDFLVNETITAEEVQKLATELLSDINLCLNEVATNDVVPESVFGSQSLYNTMAMHYFVIIGHFSNTKAGVVLLEKTGIFQSLMEIMTPKAQDQHVRLAISALDYTKDGSARVILSKALTATSESCRLYSTNLLRVLLRAGTPHFSTWGIQLLVTQLYDQSPAVSSAALATLDEACDIEPHLLTLIKIRPSVLHLGDSGVMLLCRFLSLPSGFRSLRDANFIPSELERWHKTYNARYVKVVEDLLYEALTSHEKSSHGTFTRRSLHKGPKKEVFLPAHLYGQLALHEEGMELLKREPCLQEYFSMIHNQDLQMDSEIDKMKEALWAVGHVGSSSYGVSLLEEENMVPELIRLAEECGVFSIRGTAFYVLGLVASTRHGAQILAKYGWESQCHTRKEHWPVLDEHGVLPEHVEEAIRMADTLGNLRTAHGEAGRLSSAGSAHLSFIKEETVRMEQNGDVTITRNDSGVLKLDLTVGDGRVFSTTSVTSDTSETFMGVSRSRTLPNESQDFRRYQSLPSRSMSERHIHRKGLPLSLPTRSLVQQATGVVTPDVINPDAIAIKVEGVGDEGSESVGSPDTCQVAPSPVIRLRADSEEEPASPEFMGIRGKEPIFRIGSHTGSSGSSGGGGHKEDRSSSEGSQRSKGRTDSFNTDSTTSGVSSCESGNLPNVAATLSSLSPIPSSSSLNTLSTSGPTPTLSAPPLASSPTGVAPEPAHPSTAHRKRWNLTRIPSFRRLSASTSLGSHHSLPGSRSSTFFTTHRDVLGYATLRNIRRKRTYSADDEPGGGTETNQSKGGEPRISRTISVESDTSVDNNIWLSIRRNVSSVSLSDMEHQGQQLAATGLTSFKPFSQHNRFIGLAMPVDVNMMFEVIEGEDARSTVQKQMSPEESLDEQLSELRVSSAPPLVPPLREEPTFEHSRDKCLLCSWCRQRCFKTPDTSTCLEEIPSIDADADSVGRKDSDADSMVTGHRDIRSRGGSMNEQLSSATPGSQTSSTTNSSDSASKKLTEDSDEGRRLIRMEVLRLITNLSSSVGLKGSEQGLLSLKQKFPSTFKDVCFFSEVCAIISSLSFRLNARRFIQELFDEIDITKLLEGPYSFLGIVDDEVPHMAPIRQDSMDSFADFS